MHFALMLLKKLTNLGQSRALILDKSILDLFDIKQDTVLKISTMGKRMVIEPATKEEIELYSKRKEPHG